MLKKTLSALLLTSGVTTWAAFAQEPKARVKPEWIERSDQVTQQLLEIRFDDQPEGAHKKA